MPAKIDLHVHSKYSERPSEWFLQRIGAGESYSEPEDIYNLAKKRGMDFVTITDHNRAEGSFLLNQAHPEDTIVGVEATTYFPDKCKIHLLIYDFDERQFEEIQNIRKDVVELRDYIRENDLAHSVAHPTYAVNGKLTVENFEKLALLFDVFEQKNGNHGKLNNINVRKILDALTPEKIEDLRRKHGIEPFGDKSWIKGYTGGSDDHGGVFIGKTYTTAKAKNPRGLLKALKSKKTGCEGRDNDFKGLAFGIYKVAWDFSKSAGKKFSNQFLMDLSDNIFEWKEMNFLKRMKIRSLEKLASLKSEDYITHSVFTLFDKLSFTKTDEPDERFDIVYKTLGDLVDHMIIEIVETFTKNLDSINFTTLYYKVTQLLPAAFAVAPFLSSMYFLNKDRKLINELLQAFGVKQEPNKKKILWFTDTIDDLNGVSVTLNKMGSLAHERKLNLKLVSIPNEESSKPDLPESMLYLNLLQMFDAPYYDKVKIKVPSIFDALQKAAEYEPDEIFISTPSFIGLLGLMISRLMGLRSTGVYHSDFTLQMDEIVDVDSLPGALATFMNWFYSKVDAVAVPNEVYKNVVVDYGHDENKVVFLRKGIETKEFNPKAGDKKRLKKKFGVKNGVNLLFTGRISPDKGVDLLVEIFDEVAKEFDDANLLIVGDGPYLEKLREKCSSNERIYLPGGLKWEDMPPVYAASDLFIFPSETDTFGMSVLEAQACGLPCLVSDKGGPQEIIIEGETGFVLSRKEPRKWIDKTLELMRMIAGKDPEYAKMRKAAFENADKNFTWDAVFEDIFNQRH